MSKPAVIKGVVGGVLLLAALVLIAKYAIGGSGYNPSAGAQEVKIVCSETGESWTMVRGRLMDALYSMPYPIDPEQGLSSPHANGRRVAFPEDRSLWREMVNRANSEIAAAANFKPGEQQP
ncbi:MAG: hypothetical protein CMJ31_12265 [Phycisphaerae bacterium]|nr:hypothetical protein [Phycisphaerae bacterium]